MPGYRGTSGNLLFLSAGKGLRRLWGGEERMLDWLCDSGGLAGIGRMLGEEAVLYDRQVRTAGGRADLVLELPRSGRTAVVEAQLEDADADHLGRLICYCSDIGAEIGVLIARRVGERIGGLCAALNDRPGRGMLLAALELSSVSDGGGSPLGAILHPPPGDGGGEEEEPPAGCELLRTEPLIGRGKLRPALTRLLGEWDPELARMGGLRNRIGPLIEELEAGSGQDLLCWPVPAPAGLCAALGRMIAAGSRRALVLCRDRAADAEWILPSLRCALGGDAGLTAWSYRLGPRIDRRREIEFSTLPAPGPGGAAGPAGFWRRVAARLPSPEHGRILATGAQLSHRLSGSGCRLVACYDRAWKEGRYRVVLRIRSDDPGHGNRLLELLRGRGETLRARLPGFELEWVPPGIKRGARLRCRSARPPDPAREGGDEEAVAGLVAALGSELEPLAKETGDSGAAR